LKLKALIPSFISSTTLSVKIKFATPAEEYHVEKTP